jgi:uncharacterized protein YkwD
MARKCTSRRLLAAVAAAAVTSLGVLSSASAAAPHSWYAGVEAACASSPQKMLCYHNRTRRLAGLPALRVNAQLHRAAQLKRDRIAACRDFAHRPCGDRFMNVFWNAGYVGSGGSWLVGENLTLGYPDPWETFDGLMQSPHHRANILEPDFREFAAGLWRSPLGPVWVLEYGRRY